jgi:hypothetical protein
VGGHMGIDSDWNHVDWLVLAEADAGG